MCDLKVLKSKYICTGNLRLNLNKKMADPKISEGGKNVYWSIKFCYV